MREWNSYSWKTSGTEKRRRERERRRKRERVPGICVPFLSVFLLPVGMEGRNDFREEDTDLLSGMDAYRREKERKEGEGKRKKEKKR